MRYLILILVCVSILSCATTDLKAAGVWQYCGDNTLNVTIKLVKQDVTGHVIVTAYSVPNPPTSVDLLYSADPSSPKRWKKIDRETVPPGGGNVTLEYDGTKNADIIYFIVDDSGEYLKTRQPC